MNKKQAKKRLDKLRMEIDDHRYKYHVLDKPEISDAAYDSLFHELNKLEEQYPDLITSDSPSQRVGGKPLDKFEKVQHLQRMMSINDIFDFEELKEWQERLVRMGAEKAIKSSGYFAELKMDGLAVSLIYKKGILQRGATRGDGTVGEDITQNLRTIKSIPLRLREVGDLHNREIEVRGEVFLSKGDFEKLNKEREKKGLVKYANPRNIAAGSIRQLDPKVTKERDLDFFVYEISTNVGFKSHQEEHQLAKSLGFKTNQNNKHCKDLLEVQKYVKHWDKAREKLPYQTDGVVIILEDKQAFDRLGTVGKSRRGMIAYKFAAEEATSHIKNIVVQVGRTGKLTPVAIMEPTVVAGSTVSRATLHNEDEIKRKDVRVGDTVVIRKAGDVIPEVVSVIKKMRPKNAKEFLMPHRCPICKGKVVRKKGEVDFYCADPKCSVRRRRQIDFFVSKNAFNIDGLGPKIVEQLINKGLIDNPADLFELRKGDLEPLERFAQKSASNVTEAINKSKKISLERFIYALGIRHVGTETAVDVAKHFVKLKYILRASKEDFSLIYGIGERVAESLWKYFSDSQNIKFIKRLMDLRVKISPYHSPIRKNLLGKKSFVVTGMLNSMTREDAHKKIVQFGGIVSSSVTSKTDFLIMGEDPGSKLERAKKFGTKILSEKEFLKIIK